MSHDSRHGPGASTSRPSHRGGRIVATAFALLAAALGLWWYTSPERWTRQAESFLPDHPAQADMLAEEALNAGTSMASRAWLVRCRAQLALKHPIEAAGAFTQIQHPEECDVAAWCDLIEEAQAARHELLADMAQTAALRFRHDRVRVLTLALPSQAGTRADAEIEELVTELRGLAGQQAAAWRVIGLTEQLRGRLAEAAQAYQQSLALSDVSQPVGLSCRRELAQLWIDLGEFSSAEPLVLEVLKTTSSPLSEDQVRLAQLRRSSGDRTGARQLLDEVLSQEPEHLASRLLRGTLLAELGQLPAAQADFEQCVQIAPSHTEAHYRLSQTMLRQGQSASAAKHLQEHRRLSEVQHRLLETGRRRAAAPRDPQLMLEMADLFESLGQPNTATEWRRAAQALHKP